MENQLEVIGFRYEMFTEPPAVKPFPLSIIESPAGPEVGETVSEPKLSVNGLPNPVTKSYPVVALYCPFDPEVISRK